MNARNTRLTPTEAAIVTQVPLKRLNRLIDERVLPRGAAGFDGRRQRRYVVRDALVAVRVMHEMSALLSPAGRRRIARALLASGGKRAANDNAVEAIAGSAARVARRAVANGLRLLDRAHRLIGSDPSIMGGTPCIRGTRVPAWIVAALLANDGPEFVREDYPQLSGAQIEAARDYMALYPRRGRPPAAARGRATAIYRKTDKGWRRTPA